jgi:hypothetical protein
MASPNMNLIIPVPTQTLGPLYAQQIATCFDRIDSHNHTFGDGSQIPLSALSVSQALPMNNYPISNASYVSLAEQITAPTQGGSLYMQGGELYFRNGAGTFDIKMTNGATVNVPGTAGFAGLLPPASATYSSSNFIFQSGTNIAGNLDAASIKIRNTNPSSNAITINAPNPLPADYSMTLPASNPLTNSFLMVDSSGVITNNVAPDNTTIQIVGNQLVASFPAPPSANVVYSSQQNIFLSAGAGGLPFTNISGLAATITTSGNPVVAFLINGSWTLGSNGVDSLQSQARVSVNGGAFFGAAITNSQYATGPGTFRSQNVPMSVFWFFPSLAAGTYSFQAQFSAIANVQVSGSGTLVAYELK